MGFTYIGPRLASQLITYFIDENIGGHIYTVTWSVGMAGSSVGFSTSVSGIF